MAACLRSQTPNQPFRGSSQFHATPRFAASTPRPSSTQTGATFATPALVIKTKVPRNRSTQDIIDDSSPISPEDGLPSGLPISRDSLPESIEIDSSLVPQSSLSPEEPGEGRPPKRRRISIASSEPEADPLVSSQHSQGTDLGSLPDAPGDRIVSYYSDVDEEDYEVEVDVDEDDGPNISPTQSIPSSPTHQHSPQTGDGQESELDDMENDAEAADSETPKRTNTKPTVRAGPRFKLTEPPDKFTLHPDTYLSADIFSPQRRGAKYLPGGLAAELRDWLVDVKGGVDGEGEVKATSSSLSFTPAAGAAKVVVSEVARGGPGMTLVSGKVVDGRAEDGLEQDVSVRVILAGEGSIEGLGGVGGTGNRNQVAPGTMVAIEPPAWDVELDGRTAFKKSDPLRILFCGSDEFSCASLKALHNEHKHNTNLIQSIDVVVRPSKPTGRGYKVIREVPLRGLAEQLSLPIHVRDTFTGWDMPKPDGDSINLIVAVSFGLFVPPRLIHASKYGGLNGLHVPPHEPCPTTTPPPAATTTTTTTTAPPPNPTPQSPQQPKLLHAPKITSQDKQLLWTAHGAGEVVRRAAVLGSLWTHLGRSSTGGGGGGEKRAILADLSVVEGPPPDWRVPPGGFKSKSTSASSSGKGKGKGGVGSKRGVNWDGDGVVVWVQKTALPLTREARKAGEGLTWEAESVTSKYWVDRDRESVVVRMGGSWLRIGMIKVEGSTFKPARVVLDGWGARSV
ncbi:hypothetical protein F5144DRAFT_619131 [Chaetomium tenue]|uniref:Uncharacterized protein n=1 Tax=Chaetomium tenue TaxID=1854479 RepID=A0ACB7PJE4_9PEZI|nr:hypothetical protein F5144DRAFT_619131 [Chaetomium globosum]